MFQEGSALAARLAQGCPRKLRVLNLTTQSDGNGAPGRVWRQRYEMSFTPTTAQLELLAELEMARMPVALIANRLGVDLATFKAWTARLDASRDFEEPPSSSAEIVRKPLVEHELRVIAEHVFEGE